MASESRIWENPPLPFYLPQPGGRAAGRPGGRAAGRPGGRAAGRPRAAACLQRNGWAGDSGGRAVRRFIVEQRRGHHSL